MSAQIWPVMAPVLASVLVGLIWGRLGKPFDSDMVSRLVMYVGAPCLIIATLSEVRLAPEALVRVAWVYLLVLMITALAALLLLWLLGYRPRVFFTSLVFPNVGNMGLPLCLLAFGEEGLALGLAWFMLNSVAHFSLGLSVVSGRPVWRELFTNPVVASVLVAVVLVATGAALPGWLFNSLDLLGGLTIPLMLVTLGVSLSRLRVHDLKTATLFSVARLVLGFLVALGVCEWLDIQGVLRGVVILQSSMPVAVFNYLFAVRYGEGPREVAGTVVLSTLMAFLALPFLLGWLLR